MSCFLCWPCDSCVSGCSELHVQPVGSLPLLHPKVKTVWADLPWSCCRYWGSIQLIPCREAIHPKASMQILGGSITYCQGKSSSLGLLPLEKSSGTGAKDTSAAGECSTQDRLSIQPVLLAQECSTVTQEYWLCFYRKWSLDVLRWQPGLCMHSQTHWSLSQTPKGCSLNSFYVYWEVWKCKCASLQRLIGKLHSCRRKLWSNSLILTFQWLTKVLNGSSLSSYSGTCILGLFSKSQPRHMIFVKEYQIPCTENVSFTTPPHLLIHRIWSSFGWW